MKFRRLIGCTRRMIRGLCDIEITEKIVLEKLDGLRDDKAAGADDLFQGS